MKCSPACLTAALGSFLFAGVIVAGSCLSEGLSMGQRVMTDLAMPVGLAWLGALAAMLYQWRCGNRSAAVGFALVFLAVGVLFGPLVSDLADAVTEAPPVVPAPTSAEGPRYDTLVVLGGGASRNLAGQAEMNRAGERLALAAKMWHAGKTEAIICTGMWATTTPGAAAPQSMTFDADDPAEIGREILVALAVPEDRIFRSAGENTLAEMRHLAAFLKDPPEGLPAGSKVGLITSAFHLPRAMRLAKTQNLNFQPLPAGSRGRSGSKRGIGIVVPTAGAGESVARVAKEWLAWLLGR